LGFQAAVIGKDLIPGREFVAFRLCLQSQDISAMQTNTKFPSSSCFQPSSGCVTAS
jgi:hypothetical protein